MINVCVVQQLTEDDVVRIADFGLARPIAEMTRGVVGTLAYMAPEIMLRSGRYGTAVDVYRSAREHNNGSHSTEITFTRSITPLKITSPLISLLSVWLSSC